MFRKPLLLISLIISGLFASAQYTAEWYKYPVFSDNVDAIVETSNKVFYLSGGNLFSFSPDDNESYFYSLLNRLNDNVVTGIYYNIDKKYLLVAYETGNIDLIFDNGNIVNMPEIRDASVASSKTINDVAFSGERIYVATPFGIVVYNDQRYEVVESGIYNQNITAIDVNDEYIVMYNENDNKVYASPVGIRHNSLSKFNIIGGIFITDLKLSGDEYMIAVDRSNKILLYKIDFANSTIQRQNITAGDLQIIQPLRDYTKGIYAATADKLVTIENGQIATKPLVAPVAGNLIAIYNNTDDVWTGSAEGIARYDIASATPTVLYDKMLPDGITTDRRVGFMRWSADGKRLYISNKETSNIFSFAKGEGSTNYQTTNVITDGHPVDASIRNSSGQSRFTVQYRQQFGNDRMYGDPTWIVEDPDDPEKYYCGNHYEGVYVIKYNPESGRYEEIGRYTETNSTIPTVGGPRVIDVNIDREGNLWVGHLLGSLYTVLPAEKRRQDPATVTQADWKPLTYLEPLEFYSKDMTSLLCKKSDMLFIISAKYEKGFLAIDTKGTYTNTSDDVLRHIAKVTDQDGNEIAFTYITSIVEDHRGCVWVGTTSGVFEITNPSKATDPNMTVRRIKVPRNDGTNFADYLLESDQINWITVDPSDRKWIATQNSGIYLVSETGDEILRHYDSSNSPLPSNLVCSIEADPHSNTVYVGTVNGLYSFTSDSSPAQTDYESVYAFPNPVRPEYSGLVTITGLMDNSVVKIADAAGNVVYETRSEGGMATWDTCGRDGNRVRSGVYYVYSSQNNGNSSTGSVTKILVIN